MKVNFKVNFMVKFYKILYDSIKKQTSFKNQIMKFLSFTENIEFPVNRIFL